MPRLRRRRSVALRPTRVVGPGPADSGSLLLGVLPFRTGIRGVIDHGLVQYLAALVQGTLDYPPGLVHNPLHRLTGLVDRLLKQVPGLIGYLSYGLVRPLPDLSHRLSRCVAHPLGRLAHASGYLAYRAPSPTASRAAPPT